MDEFSRILKARLRTENTLKVLYQEDQKKPKNNTSNAIVVRDHIAGQRGCFCRECLLFRKEEWRIGDINTKIVGPRNRVRINVSDFVVGFLNENNRSGYNMDGATMSEEH